MVSENKTFSPICSCLTWSFLRSNLTYPGSQCNYSLLLSYYCNLPLKSLWLSINYNIYSFLLVEPAEVDCKINYFMKNKVLPKISRGSRELFNKIKSLVLSKNFSKALTMWVSILAAGFLQGRILKRQVVSST